MKISVELRENEFFNMLYTIRVYLALSFLALSMAVDQRCEKDGAFLYCSIAAFNSTLLDASG